MLAGICSMLALDAYAVGGGGGHGGHGHSGGGSRGSRSGHDRIFRDSAPTQAAKHSEHHHKKKSKNRKSKTVEKETANIPQFASPFNPPQFIMAGKDQFAIIEIEPLPQNRMSDEKAWRYIEKIYREGYLKDLKKEEEKSKANDIIFIINSVMTAPGLSIPDDYFSSGFNFSNSNKSFANDFPHIHFLPEVNPQSIQIVPFLSATDFENIHYAIVNDRYKRAFNWQENHTSGNQIFWTGIPVRPPDPHGYRFYQPTKVEPPLLEWKPVNTKRVEVINDVM